MSWSDKEVVKMKNRGFEVVSKYADDEVVKAGKPSRKTTWSAGYDMVAAHDVIIQPLGAILNTLLGKIQEERITDLSKEVLQDFISKGQEDLAAAYYQGAMCLTLDEIKAIMKKHKLQPTLVSTGYKAYMRENERLDLSAKSGLPLNSFIILGNPPGLIDADYYNNPDNEGEIFFQFINLSPVPIQIKKGDAIGQGVFNTYLTTDDDDEQPKKPRVGGFGSTSK